MELTSGGAIDCRERRRGAEGFGFAPFRHFASRLALLVAVAEEGARRMIERMDAAAANQTEPLERERARGVAYVRFAVEQCGYFRAISRPEVLAQSTYLQAASAASEQMLDAVLARVKGTAASRIARRAERLAVEVTGVLGGGVAGDAA